MYMYNVNFTFFDIVHVHFLIEKCTCTTWQLFYTKAFGTCVTNWGNEMLKFIMIEVKQGFLWGKYLSDFKKGGTYTTPDERMGMNLERIRVFTCILGREIRNSENKNGHAWLCATIGTCRCMQLVGWRGGGKGWYAALMVEGDSKTTLGMPFWKNCSLV